MAKPSKKTPEQKLQIVLAVLRGELSAMEASRRNGVSEQSCTTGRGCSSSQAERVWRRELGGRPRVRWSSRPRTKS